jgi:uncharacterized protein YbjT (DUF2867 family)
MKVLVLGGTGRIGGLVAESLFRKGYSTFASFRNKNKTQNLNLTWIELNLDIDSIDKLKLVIIKNDIKIVFYCLPLSLFQKFSLGIKFLDIKVIALGSSRKYSKIPDPSVKKVCDAVSDLKKASNDWIFIHPTMIYGKTGENNLSRIAALIKIIPIIPLPRGGSSLIQPIHAKNVAEALINATSLKAFNNEIVLGGPQSITYKNLFKLIAKVLNKRIIIIKLPKIIFKGAILLSQISPFFPKITTNEFERFYEDKIFETFKAYKTLNIKPISLEAGLKETFEGN